MGEAVILERLLPTEPNEQLTVHAALTGATTCLKDAGIDEARLDAQLLLAWALAVRREDLAREPERILSPRVRLIFEKAISLRAARRPVAYLTGEQWFYGRPFKINRAVLIPRPETELLVAVALSVLPRAGTVADIGTGSGCIAVTIAAERSDIHAWATDISPLALRVAAKNAHRHGVSERVTLVEGDLLAPLVGLRFDAIVSNPPYIAAADMAGLMPEVRDYEPITALSLGAGEDGMHLHRRLLADARARLTPGGWLAMEVGQGQAPMILARAQELGYNECQLLQDGAGIARIVAARRDGAHIETTDG